MEKEYKMCQSCSMPLNKDPNGEEPTLMVQKVKCIAAIVTIIVNFCSPMLQPKRCRRL